MTKIRIERDSGIGRVLLATPERQNMLDREAADGLFAAFQELEQDASVRVVHLTGEGDDFCTGPDLAAMAKVAELPGEANRDDAEALGRVFLAMRALMKPIVCSVRGRALSSGVGLAVAADIVLAHADAEFGFPEVRVGYVPALPLSMLRRAVAEKRTADIILTGRIINAEEAERMGLVSRVLPAASYDDELSAMLAGLVRLSPTSLALSKWLLYKLDELSVENGVAAGVVTDVEARGTEDFKAVLRSFREPPTA